MPPVASVSLNRPGQSPTPKVSNLPEPEQGWTFGSVIIRNNCKYTVSLTSVGAWYLGGCRDNVTGFGTPEDMIVQNITAGSTYAEPYRITAPLKSDTNGGANPFAWYHEGMDKLAGQGISMKIANETGGNNVFQFEYALVQDPFRGDSFLRMNYDVSLLDCANPEPLRHISDANATDADHTLKLQGCPGYENGVAVTFTNDPKGDNCAPFYCSGQKKCMLIYTWDRTREGEASMACEKDAYKGDMVVDLCVGGNAERNRWVPLSFDCSRDSRLNFTGRLQTNSQHGRTRQRMSKAKYWSYKRHLRITSRSRVVVPVSPLHLLRAMLSAHTPRPDRHRYPQRLQLV
ncbi:hypothetical protein BS50DRAFT_498484 [Corynespora cassiicola Philippines]|uniref:Uncharacterized protein n=1 Tax=Corynespora cassiicola Philippines TaxID=1448308 RepID=A0A2T2NGJ3_CORCC|nr:hypothetical protein BS50DRAFT_498484 [Corynespora cassiicola Philippines]